MNQKPAYGNSEETAQVIEILTLQLFCIFLNNLTFIEEFYQEICTKFIWSTICSLGQAVESNFLDVLEWIYSNNL